MADQPGDRITSATAQIQATAKWIIAAFAGVGAALIAGLQLTGLGKLDIGELAIAVGGLVLALVAVFGAIWVVAKVLTPPMVLLGELPAWVGRLTDEDETLLMGQGPDLEALLARYKRVDEESRTRQQALDEAREHGVATEIEDAERLLDAKNKEFKRLNQPVAFLRRLALNLKVRDAFTSMWRLLALAVIAATIGVVVLAYMTNQPEDKKTPPPGTTKAVGQAPVGVKVELSGDERALLAPRLGKRCPPGPLWGLAIGGRPVALDVVTLPTPRCRSVRVIVTPAAGVVIHRSPAPRVIRAERLARAAG